MRHLKVERILHQADPWATSLVPLSQKVSCGKASRLVGWHQALALLDDPPSSLMESSLEFLMASFLKCVEGFECLRWNVIVVALFILNFKCSALGYPTPLDPLLSCMVDVMPSHIKSLYWHNGHHLASRMQMQLENETMSMLIRSRNLSWWQSYSHLAGSLQ